MKRERILETFAAHRERREEYGSRKDTVMNFALKTGYNIDIVAKERKFRQLT